MPHSHAELSFDELDSHASKPHMHFGVGSDHKKSHGYASSHGHASSHKHEASHREPRTGASSHNHGRPATKRAMHVNGHSHHHFSNSPKPCDPQVTSSEFWSLHCEVVRLTTGAHSQVSHPTDQAVDRSEILGFDEARLIATPPVEHDCDAVYIGIDIAFSTRLGESFSTISLLLLKNQVLCWSIPNIVREFPRQTESCCQRSKIPIYLMHSSLLI